MRIWAAPAGVRPGVAVKYDTSDDRQRDPEPIPRRDDIDMEVCPRCGWAKPTELGTSRSLTIWLKCPRCSHVWLIRGY